MQTLVRRVPVADHVAGYAAQLVMATHAEAEQSAKIAKRYLRYGASPRAMQSIMLAAKVAALLDGRYNVSFKDIRGAALPALRHRLVLNFEAEADGVDPDAIVREILKEVKPPQ